MQKAVPARDNGKAVGSAVTAAVRGASRSLACGSASFSPPTRHQASIQACIGRTHGPLARSTEAEPYLRDVRPIARSFAAPKARTRLLTYPVQPCGARKVRNVAWVVVAGVQQQLGGARAQLVVGRAHGRVPRIHQLQHRLQGAAVKLAPCGHGGGELSKVSGCGHAHGRARG
jgi:hypothetical protein